MTATCALPSGGRPRGSAATGARLTGGRNGALAGETARSRLRDAELVARVRHDLQRVGLAHLLGWKLLEHKNDLPFLRALALYRKSSLD